jgi:hypothetical protein
LPFLFVYSTFAFCSTSQANLANIFVGSPNINVVLPYRSIQIGIGRALSQKFVEEYIDSIEDVTEMAAKLREEIERIRKEGEKVDEEKLIEKGCLPREKVYDDEWVDAELRTWLRMDAVAEE